MVDLTCRIKVNQSLVVYGTPALEIGFNCLTIPEGSCVLLHDKVIIFMHSWTEGLQGGPSTEETLASEHPTSLSDHALQCWLRYVESDDGQDLDDAISAVNNAEMRIHSGADIQNGSA